MKCTSCGGDNAPQADVCAYCGSQLPRRPGSEEGGRQSAFERIRASAEYARRNDPARLARLPRHTALQQGFALGFFVLFTAVSAFILIMAVGMSGAMGMFAGRGPGGALAVIPLCMAIVPAAFVAFGIYGFIKMKAKMHALSTAPVEALPVVVSDKRTEVSGGSGDSSSRTEYFVTCESEDGNRVERQVWDGRLYGRLASGDAGVLFVRADYVLDFDRVAT